MADGRRGGPPSGAEDDPPRGGSDGYDWLYASGSGPGRGSPADDAPTQQWGPVRGGDQAGNEATQVFPAFDPRAGRPREDATASTYDRFGGPPPVRIAPTPGGPGSPPGGRPPAP